MKYKLFIIGLILAVSSLAHADVYVDELQLGYQNGEVVFKIHANGSFQYTHETAEAKDGKPFRVLVDIFPAVHNLDRKDFRSIPISVISLIRTSQYSVKPTKTVRMVLDLKQTSVYRIEKKDQWVYVYIPDGNINTFTDWSTGRSPALVLGENKKTETASKTDTPKIAKTDDNKNEQKPLAVKSDASQTSTAQKTQPPVVNEKPAFSYQKPESSSVVDFRKVETKAVRQPVETSTDKNEKPQPQKKQQKSEFASAPLVKPAAKSTPKEDKINVPETKKATAKDEVKEPEEKSAGKVKKVEQIKKPVTDEKLRKVKKSPTVKNAKVTTPEQKDAPAVTKTQPAKKETQKSTSRFRRQPAFSAKLKGTIVAEFPKRMVIKYRVSNPRDPFASLIDKEAARHDQLTARRIPNVETSRLVGILESVNGKNRALLEDMDGYGFILKPGDKVKKGYISKIYSDKALFQLFEYGWSRTVALRLNEQ